jgi:6-phosphogluconolactonase
MLTRRRFLLTLPAFAAAQRLAFPGEALAQQSLLPHFHRKVPPPAPPTFVYFGTDTAKGVAKGIYLSRFDPVAGRLTAPQLVAETPRPSFLAIATLPDSRRCLYAVNAIPDPSATVSSFLVDPATGALKPINQVTSAGAGPAYISVDATGHAAFVANYVGSSISTYRILPSGGLSDPVERIDYKDRRFATPNSAASGQAVPHPHSMHLSPDNRFLLVNDLGSDEISVFAIDPDTARLGPPALFSNERPGSGPRHLAFHPNGRWVYSINEIDSTVDLFLWTTTSSRTAPQGLLIKTGNGTKTIAPNFPAAKNTAAEVAVSPDGHFLYASNRGEDSLVVFAIAPADGTLTLIERISSGGKTPRQFTLSPTGNWLVCGDQDSATVAVFRRDSASGRIGGPTQTIPLDSPMFTLFA